MKHDFMLLFVLAALVSGCGQQEYRASARLEDSAQLIMKLHSLYSFQSDWHRSLTINNSGAEVTTDLFEDTGWWRGSNLYLLKSGIYVLHEGQDGCRAFMISPPEFVDALGISCNKMSRVPQENSAQRLKGFSPSRFYNDMFYIGRFAEVRGAPFIHFIPSTEQSEIELPDIL